MSEIKELIERLEKLLVKASPGPWEEHGVRGDAPYARHPTKGLWKVVDIRGWGFLTGQGHGALGLSHEEAAAIQTANAEFIATARDAVPLLIVEINRLRALQSAETDDRGAESVRLLYANSVECVRQHHGSEELPPWLADCRRDLAWAFPATRALGPGGA